MEKCAACFKDQLARVTQLTVNLKLAKNWTAFEEELKRLKFVVERMEFATGDYLEYEKHDEVA